MASISNAHVELVKKIVDEKWSPVQRPSYIDEADLTVGMVVLAKIAAEAVVDQSSSVTASDSPSISASHRVSLNPELSDDTASKIKAFVENNVWDFKKACETGFPFSSLDILCAKHALKAALDSNTSILFRFMYLYNEIKESDEMKESDLDQQFGESFQRLQVSEIVNACSRFSAFYIDQKQNQVGYYLLWLIKQAAGCVYEIPRQSSFDHLRGKLRLSRRGQERKQRSCLILS